MNGPLLFIMCVLVIGIVWSVVNFIKKHGILDIMVGAFCLLSLIGALRLYTYAKEGYHV